MASWEPPPSADVSVGWLTLVYELQYRRRNSSHWKVLEHEFGTQKSIYGLSTGEEYELRVHCAMRAFNKFGEFSDAIFVHVSENPSKESTFTVTLVLIFGAVGLAILLMLIIFSQQQRLMVILLPPVPAPKIKGIDPELLKDESWVEFIELDADEPEPGEKEDNQSSDTQRLLGLGMKQRYSSDENWNGTASIPDNDYDPELPDQETLMLMAALLSSQPDKVEPCLGNQRRHSALEVLEVPYPGLQAPEGGERPLVQTQLGGPHSWVNINFYAQVSDVMPTGGVVLSPGQQVRAPENAPTTEEDKKKKGKMEGGEEESEGEEEERRNKKLRSQLLVVDPEAGGYTTESSGRQISTPDPSSPREVYHTFPPPPPYLLHTTPLGDYQSPYILPDSPAQFLPPVLDYTVVQDVDSQHSLLLNPTSPQRSPSCTPQPPFKPLPTMPIGYLTPDLLGNILP
ncbi:unnamed protein product [Coregonus sp. 'balchen']|nr:unnamed protein product [Coregonus sp. 'balchen']